MTYSDIDINKLLNREIVVHPLDEKCIQGNGIDLRIGIIKPLSQIDAFMEDDNAIVIPPKCYCVVITKEYVWLSGKLIGTLHARGTLAAKGLFTNATNVDPNFKGQMIMSVFNVSEKPIRLEKEETFITLILHKAKSKTKKLVGDEDSKKSMRVIKTFREEIYKEGDEFIKHRKSISQIQNYYNDSISSTNGGFEDRVKQAQSSTIFKRTYNKIQEFLVGKKIGEIAFGFILFLLSVFFIYGIVSTYIEKKEFVSMRIAVATFSIILMYNTLKKHE